MSIFVVCPSCGKKLKASESAVGKTAKCPHCSHKFTVPQPVYDAEEVDDALGPPQPSDPFKTDGRKSLLDEENEYRLARSPADVTPDPKTARRPCPVCGEMIVASAAMCRFCGEVFDPTLKKKSKRVAEIDQDMTTGDWVVAVLCSGIGCIAGIVWLIQGKPKGGKMLGVSLAFVVLWNILSMIVQTIAN